MDRRELLLGFIRHNLTILTNSMFLDSIYKKKKHDFFLEKNAKSKQGVPKDSEIANELVWYLLRVNVIKTDSDLTNYLELPFLQKNIRNSKAYYDSMALRNDKQTTINFSDVKRADYLQSLKEQIKNELRYDEHTSKITDIDEEIKKKIEEYESLPSVIDSEDFPEPPPSRQISDSDDFVVWWKQLHLTADPFPTTEGLRRVDPASYESVVVKTPLFQKYSSFIQNTSDEVFKNTIFFGEFGSGKTTLFEYLGKVFSSKGIESIYIQLYSEKDLQSLKITFKEKLIDELSYYLGFGVGEIGIDSNGSVDSTLRYLLDQLFKKKKPNGLVIFVDDLHKNKDDAPISLEFLSYLQIFTSEIIRKVPTDNLAFYIAGAREWEPVIRTQPKYSGSLSRRETIPDVTEDEAWNMLNRRLQAFYPNPEVKRIVDKAFVSQVYRDLQTSQLELTFRSFIQRLVDEFKLGNFKVLSSDPVHIKPETLSKIKEIIEAKPILKERFENLLLNRMQNDENRMKSVRLLLEIFIKRGVKEEDYLEDRFYLQALARTRLIQKSREKADSFSWVVCKELIGRSKVIARNFSLSIEDYLLKIYGLSPKKRKAASEELERLERLISVSDADGKSILRNVSEIHKEIMEVQDTYTLNYPEIELASKCRLSLEELTHFYIDHIETMIEDSNDNRGLSFWKDYWFSPEEISKFTGLVSDEAECQRRIWYVCSIYRQAFDTLLNFIQKEYSNLSAIHIDSTGLENTETADFVKARDLWVNGMHARSYEVVYSTIQTFLRNYVQNVYTILYGDFSGRIKQLEPDLQDKINERLTGRRQSQATPLHEFTFMTLEEIGTLITSDGQGSSSAWEHVFSKVLTGYTLEEIIEYFRALTDMRKEEEAESEFSKSHSLTLRDLILSSVEIARNLNSSYSQIIEQWLNVETVEGTINLYMSGDGMRDKRALKPIEFNRLKLKRLIDAISMAEVKLSDQTIVEAYYSITYKEFFAYLGLLTSQNADRIGIAHSYVLDRTKGARIKIRRLYNFSSEDAPNIFLSHSSKDSDFAITLSDDLKRYDVKVWLYEFEVRVGDSIPLRINDALAQCNFFAIVLTGDSVNSDWVKKELSSAFITELEKKSITILPILLKPCNIPPLIIDKRYADFTNKYEEGLNQLLTRFTRNKDTGNI